MSIPTETFEEIPPGSLLARYAPAGGFDELLDCDGRIRAPWQQLVRNLESLGPGGLGQRFEQVRRLLRENGLIPSTHGVPRQADRQWELDLVPLILSQSEWDGVGAAVAQRVWLLNAIMADIYGRQSLLREGLLPPELVFGQRGFLLPCHGLIVPRGIHIHLYAAHLARGADGRWLVLADHTQGPSGAGYGLENRIVVSRMMQAEFQSMHVQRLASFFITLRETLQSLAANRGDNPRVVLLSPGPRSPTYFEDAYLARYLGYTLVEGGDLTVRGTSVYLKTLGGLLPVDVILRRMLDEDCDPLELKSDSLHGVTGLVQAARSGQVVVANALGSGLLEAPALMAFLPAICRHFLGEELKLSSVPTWWCGGRDDWQYVESHFDQLIVRPASSLRAEKPVVVATLGGKERAELLEAVRNRPAAYVAQATVQRSTAPVWSNGVLQPWPVGVRAFAVADRNGAYQMMPGGLARTAPPAQWGHTALPEGPRFSSSPRGKDVWILSDRPVSTVTLLRPQVTAVELRRSGNDLPSRVADNLYWLGRHIERAEGLVRHLRTVVARMTGDLEPESLAVLTLLVRTLSEDSPLPPIVPSEAVDLLEMLEQEVLSVLFNETRGGSLDNTLRSLYQTSSVVRDRISADTWRIINQLDLDLLSPRPTYSVRLGETLSVLNQVFNLLSALSGLTTESMTRGPGWRFVDMGRRLERALSVLRLLRKTLVNSKTDAPSLLEAILEIADSSMTYRYRYLTSLQLAPLLDLLITDESNPRSIGFQLAALADHVGQLPGKESNPLRNRETRIMIATQAELRLVDIERLPDRSESGLRAKLDHFLAELTIELWQLSDSLTQTYFTHTGPSHQLGSIPSGGIV